MVVTGKNADDAAKALRNLSDDLYRQAKFTCRTPPTGGRPTRFVTYEDALQLVMALGGKQTKLMKAQCAEILTRYFAGDSTMVKELQANASSSVPLNVLAVSLWVPSACTTTPPPWCRSLRWPTQWVQLQVVSFD